MQYNLFNVFKNKNKNSLATDGSNSISNEKLSPIVKKNYYYIP